MTIMEMLVLNAYGFVAEINDGNICIVDSYANENSTTTNQVECAIQVTY